MRADLLQLITRTRRSSSLIAILCICSVRGSIAAFWSCAASTGPRRLRFSKRSSATKRCTKSASGTNSGGGSSGGPTMLRVLPPEAGRRAVDLRRSRADGHPAGGDRAAARGEARTYCAGQGAVAAFDSISNCQQGLAASISAISSSSRRSRSSAAGCRRSKVSWPCRRSRDPRLARDDRVPAIAATKSAALQLAAEDNSPPAPAFRRGCVLCLSRSPPTIPESAPSRRPRPRTGRPLSSRQRRAARTHRPGRRPVGQGARRVLRDHGQLPLRPRRSS